MVGVRKRSWSEEKSGRHCQWPFERVRRSAEAEVDGVFEGNLLSREVESWVKPACWVILL